MVTGFRAEICGSASICSLREADGYDAANAVDRRMSWRRENLEPAA